jgi:hypothetical protein
MSGDRRRERGTGFTPTPSNISIALEKNPTASAVIASNTTVERIRAWADQNSFVLKTYVMEEVKCVFTDEPIGEKNAFAFIRRKGGDNTERRIVMCRASCDVDKDRYEVLPIKNGGFRMFKIALYNMTNADKPVDLDLYRSKSIPDARPRARSSVLPALQFATR